MTSRPRGPGSHSADGHAKHTDTQGKQETDVEIKKHVAGENWRMQAFASANAPKTGRPRLACLSVHNQNKQQVLIVEHSTQQTVCVAPSSEWSFSKQNF